MPVTVVLLRAVLVLWVVAFTWLVLPFSLGLYRWVGGGGVGWVGGVGRPRGTLLQYSSKHYYFTKLLL